MCRQTVSQSLGQCTRIRRSLTCLAVCRTACTPSSSTPAFTITNTYTILITTLQHQCFVINNRHRHNHTNNAAVNTDYYYYSDSLHSVKDFWSSFNYFITCKYTVSGNNKKLSYCWETVQRESMPRHLRHHFLVAL